MGSQEARQPPPLFEIAGFSNATVPSFSSSGEVYVRAAGDSPGGRGEPGARVLGGGAWDPVKARSLVLLAGCVWRGHGQTLLPVSGPPGKAVSTDVKPRGGGANPTLLAFAARKPGCAQPKARSCLWKEATGD